MTLLEVLGVGDRDVDHRGGPALALVADPDDLAVADVPDHARPSRSRVTRSETSSTVPMASPVSMTSPTPYWSSRIMKMPERKSLTRLWAPKPSATPPTPAEASSGAEGMPTVVMIVRIAISADDEGHDAAQQGAHGQGALAVPLVGRPVAWARMRAGAAGLAGPPGVRAGEGGGDDAADRAQRQPAQDDGREDGDDDVQRLAGEPVPRRLRGHLGEGLEAEPVESLRHRRPAAGHAGRARSGRGSRRRGDERRRGVGVGGQPGLRRVVEARVGQARSGRSRGPGPR